MKNLIFIDGGNIFHSLKSLNKAKETKYKIDYLKLSKFLSDKTKSSNLRTYFYTGVPATISDKQMGFLTMLDLLPNFEVKKKTLKIKNGRPIEKGVDVNIVTDMLWSGLNKHCEHIILVSGDEDLTDAVTKLKENGISLTVAAFKNNSSKKLIRSADNYIDLSEELDKFC